MNVPVCTTEVEETMNEAEATPEVEQPQGPRIYVASLSDYNAGRLHGSHETRSADPSSRNASPARHSAAGCGSERSTVDCGVIGRGAVVVDASASSPGSDPDVQPADSDEKP